MSSKNVIVKGESSELKDSNLNTAVKPKSSWVTIENSKAVSIGMSDVSSVKTGVIIQHDAVVPLKYTDYPPFSAEQRARVNDTYKSIADNMSDTKMAKIIQDQFLNDITAKSESYLERVEDGEDIDDIRTEQAEFLNGLIDGILGEEGVINTINTSKADAEEEMKEIVSKIIIDLIKSKELSININKIDSINNDNIAAKIVISQGNEVIYEGEEVVLWEFTDTQTSTLTP